MSTEGGRAVVTARVAGRPRRLATEKQWRAAIAGGDLKPDDRVEYEAADCAADTRAAGDVPELQALFSALFPGFAEWRSPAEREPEFAPTSAEVPEPEPAVIQQAPPPRQEATVASSGEMVGENQAAGKPVKRPAASAARPVSGRASGPGKRSAAQPLLIGGGVIALLALGVVAFSGSEEDGPPPDESAAGPVAPEPAVPAPIETAPALATPTPTPAPTLSAREQALRERQRLQREARSTPTPTPTPTYEPPPPVPAVSRARAVQPRDLSRWANRIGSDYPRRAAQRGEQGTVSFRVTVGPNGRVEGCEVTSTSGSAELDRAACQGVSRYARFDPALNDAGEPIAASWSSAITYRLD